MRLIRKTTVLAAALGLASTGAAQSLLPPGSGETRPPLGEEAIRTGAIQLPQWPAGFVGKPVEAQANIFEPLATATEAALTNKGFDDLVERLTEPDRERINKDRFAERDFPELDKVIGELREKFRQKYAGDFAIDDRARVFDSKAQVAQGEVSDSNLAKDRFPIPAQEGPNPARMASGRIEPAQPPQARTDQQTPDRQKIDEPYLTTGRKVAIVSLKSSTEAIPTLNVSLANELLGKWKLDIPDSISGTQLHGNLLHHLMKLNADSANWPSNVNDAKRLFVQHVMAAMYDIPAEPTMGDTGDRATSDRPAELDRNQP